MVMIQLQSTDKLHSFPRFLKVENVIWCELILVDNKSNNIVQAIRRRIRDYWSCFSDFFIDNYQLQTTRNIINEWKKISQFRYLFVVSWVVTRTCMLDPARCCCVCQISRYSVAAAAGWAKFQKVFKPTV